MTAALATTPTQSITCWRQGVAPTSCPALRSCRLYPATAAALHTTAPMNTTATAPIADLPPTIHMRTREANRMVQIVMPETGLFDDPTRPAMSPLTEENKNPATIMMTAMASATPMLPTTR